MSDTSGRRDYLKTVGVLAGGLAIVGAAGWLRARATSLYEFPTLKKHANIYKKEGSN